MAEIINLRRRRRARDRAHDAAQAAENRVRYGQTKAEQERQQLAADQENRRLDAVKREDR